MSIKVCETHFIGAINLSNMINDAIHLPFRSGGSDR